MMIMIITNTPLMRYRFPYVGADVRLTSPQPGTSPGDREYVWNAHYTR